MEEDSLFAAPAEEPLAARLRPRNLDEFVGQKHLLGPGKILRNLIEEDKISSMIFSGGGEDNPGPDHRPYHKSQFHQLFRSDQRHQGHPHSDAAGR
nr:hypothetical protein [uncultured Acidaminococcus sp.]